MIRDDESNRNTGTDQWDWSLSQPRHELLNVSNPEDLSEGRPEGGVVPEIEIEAARRVSVRYGTMCLLVVPTSNRTLPTLRR
jgi:hypothetical protein